MHRTSGDNAVRFESLEAAVAERPEAYGRIDLLAFGFPCQDISSANPKGKGISGERSSIFFECMRIAKRLRAAWLLIENVPALLSKNGGRDFAVVIEALAECGYGYAWRILDSQYFGVPQRRRRLFIVGCFGRACPAEVLFERKGGRRDAEAGKPVRERGLRISAKEGNRRDASAETFVASPMLASDYRKTQHGQFGNEGNLIANTLLQKDSQGGAPTKGNFIANTQVSDDHRGNNSTVVIAGTLSTDRRGTDLYPHRRVIIAEADADGEGETAGVSRGLDTARGIVLGNAVTVPVAEWIGRRIVKYGIETERR